MAAEPRSDRRPRGRSARRGAVHGSTGALLPVSGGLGAGAARARRSDDHPPHLLEPPVVRADRGVLGRSLHDQHRPGEHPQEPRGSRGLSPQRAAHVRADAVRQRREPGDARLLEQHAERRPARAHAEPELRARADGAAHARRQRRLYATGRRRSRALFHRVARPGQHRHADLRDVLLRFNPPRQRQQAGAGQSDRRRRPRT